MTRSVAAVIALLIGAPLAAQAPHVTPDGDPSVRSDTIYKLAISAADNPEESRALLLDDGIVRVEADGRYVSTFRQVVQILKQSAAQSAQEHMFSYEPSHQRLTINWLRVVRPNGEVVSAQPSQVQESDVPAEMDTPVYTERKMKRASLSGVAAGTLVDYSYTLEERDPPRRGDFEQSWGVSTGLRVSRSRFILDVPQTLKPVILERNLNFARTVVTAHGRTSYMWATKDLPRVKAEPFASDSNGVYMSVAVATPNSWQDIGAWYAGLAKGRYAMPPEGDAKLHSAVAAARTLDDSIRAVHRWVAQDVRYVSIALGKGGYQPREPAKVIATGFGDCKDKATLFVAAMDRIGVTAFPVLLNAGGRPDRRLATIHAFDHAIAAVKRDSGYVFTDLTAELTPYGSLPHADQGEFGLVVHPDGQTEEVTIPRDSMTVNREESSLVGVISPEGTFDGRYEERGTGTRQEPLRAVFEHPLDSAQRANLSRALATRFFPSAAGDSLTGFDGKNLAALPNVSVLIRHGTAAKASGESSILTVPLGNVSTFAAQADALAERGQRLFPIDALRVAGDGVTTIELRFTLPVGWRAHLPKGVSATSPFGSYNSSYSQQGRELRITRLVSGARGILAPDRIGDLIAFLRAIAADDATFIVLEHGATTNP